MNDFVSTWSLRLLVVAAVAAFALIGLPVLLSLEGNDQVERSLRDLARPRRDHAGRTLAFRHTDPAFVRMRGEIFDAT